MTEFELFKALRPLYPAREYALLPQVANGTGSRATRHCDALALSLWPSRGLHLTGFEIKSSRGDWIRELRDPEKGEDMAKFCNHWYMVTGSLTIIQDGELPNGWGLLAWDEKKSALMKIKPAPFREAETKPDLPFLAASLRKAQEYIGPEAEISEAKAEGFKQGELRGSEKANYELRDLRELKAKVLEFEKTSGVKITGRWEGGDKIGEAVNLVINGTVMRERDHLLTIALRIVKDLAE